MFQPQLTQEALAREAALPENLWIQCPYCKQGSYRESLGMPKFARIAIMDFASRPKNG